MLYATFNVFSLKYHASIFVKSLARALIDGTPPVLLAGGNLLSISTSPLAPFTDLLS